MAKAGNTEQKVLPYLEPITAECGVELADLFGQPMSFVCPEVERRITEALMQDDRITGVINFTFSQPAKGVLAASFTVQTVFGDLPVERTVSI